MTNIEVKRSDNKLILYNEVSFEVINIDNIRHVDYKNYIINIYYKNAELYKYRGEQKDYQNIVNAILDYLKKENNF